MKAQSILITAALIAFAIAPVIAASSDKTKPAQASEPSAQKYTCPMHPEVIADKPGKCPKCGMNLVPVKP